MSSGNDEALLQHKEDDLESQHERQEMGVGTGTVIGKVVLNLTQLKSFEILETALKFFTKNIKFMFLMILSILPFFVFMVFYEIKLQNSITYATSNSPGNFETVRAIVLYPLDASLNDTASASSEMSEALKYDSFTNSFYYDDFSQINKRREFLSDTLQLCLFYLFLYPLLEFLSMIATIKIAVKIHAAEKPATLREVIHQKINFKGPFITYLCVYLLSTMTFLGLFWTVANYYLFSSKSYIFSTIEVWLNILSTAVHTAVFLGLLYKYLEWSAFWNMGIVISVLDDEQIGITALGMSDYYGKHCKKTGFQMMLSFFVFGNVLRLLCLYAGLCKGSVAGVLITSTVIMLASLGNLVKWIAFLLYFYSCKQQTMEKKVDDHQVGKTVNTGDLS